MDRPDLAQLMLALLQAVLPNAWAMLSAHHPIHEIGLPRLTGPRGGAKVVLRVADWALNRTSRVILTTCDCCNCRFGIVVLNARTLDLYSFIFQKISMTTIKGCIDGYSTMRLDTNIAPVSDIVAHISILRALPPVESTIHQCAGDYGNDFEIIVAQGLAFLAAHEAAHAHALAEEVFENELETDRIASAVLQQRAVYINANNISFQGRFGQGPFCNVSSSICWMFLGAEFLLHHLDFERAYVRDKRRSEISISGIPSPQQRFEQIELVIDLCIKLGLINNYYQWRLPYLVLWESIVMKLEDEIHDR